MALAPRIEIRQTQSLSMTPQLRQAIRLLQMNNLALAEYVAAEVEKNPFLELAPAPAVPPPPRTRLAGGEATDVLDAMAAEVGLIDHLLGQIGAMRAAPDTLDAARLVAEELEDDGYLRAPLAEVAARHRLPVALVERGLALVQGCEPAGIGARSLRECLALQLRERDRLDPAMQALLDHLALVGQGRNAELRALCAVDAEDLDDMLRELRALDPKPGLRFAPPAVQVAVPDVHVGRTPGGALLVELNTATLPRVLVNNRYAASLSGLDREARSFVSEMRASAGWLARSLEQRARTLLRVATELARHQEAYFAGGAALLLPLTRRAVAERLGLHESTVSRVTAGKFIACAQGVIAMRALFSAGLGGPAGDGTVSATAVREKIRRLIALENPPRPLSDDKIVTALGGEGIDVARRTVAKYRDEMGIPSSVERRRRSVAVTGI